MKICKLSFVLLALFFCGLSNAQEFKTSFYWASNSNSLSSNATINACGESINVTLVTSEEHKKHSPNKARIPRGNVTAGTVSVTLTFTPAVQNLKLLISDFDDSTITETGKFYGNLPVSANPAPPYASLNYNSGTGDVDANGSDNTGAWFTWNGLVSTVTFDYYRPISSPLTAIFLDSLAFDCLSCQCEEGLNTITAGSTTLPASGTAAATLALNSNGALISKLNISIPGYTSLIDPNCLSCDLENMQSYGHITNLPTVAGVSPSFVGGGSSGTQITYLFPSPIVINESIGLNMQFPSTLELACCENEVNYCINIGMIDENCQICETLLCSSNGASQSLIENSNPPDKEIESNILTNVSLKIVPNPGSEIITIELPHENGQLSILTLDGKQVIQKDVNSNLQRINISNLDRGTYIAHYSVAGEVYTEKFIKQ